MEPHDRIYRRLQKHLDRQPVGFPATRSQAEIRILKHIFSPREAEIVSCMSYRSEPLHAIFARVGHLAASPGELEAILERIQKNGGIEARIKNGVKHYCCAPLVVGMYEFQVNKLTPEFLESFNRYTSESKFGLEFLATRLPQMRTIPVSRSLRPHHTAAPFDQVAELVRQAPGPFVIGECICRKKRAMEGEACRVTERMETCLAVGDMARMAFHAGFGREIGKDEAMAILELNQKQGLVLQPSNTQEADFICACCGCCCGMLRLHKRLPKPSEFWAANYYASADGDSCEGCGVCQKKCPVGAVEVSKQSRRAAVDLDRCLGCGICVSHCPTDSLSLVKKPSEFRPPKTREDLYEAIMARKRGWFGKTALTGKLIFDALTTGRTETLKS